jgi:hypothetical protein
MQLLPIAKELTKKHDLDVDLEEIFPAQMAAQPAQVLPGQGGGMSIGPTQNAAEPMMESSNEIPVGGYIE